MTNRYLELNDDKTKADQEILRAEAAYKYWQTHQFDHLRCQMYDPAKEEEYLK